MISQPSIVARVTDVNQAAEDYRVCMLDPDPEVRGWLFDMLAFEIAKDLAGAHGARRHPCMPSRIEGLYASIVIVDGDRAIEVSLNLMTRTGHVRSDERVRGAA